MSTRLRGTFLVERISAFPLCANGKCNFNSFHLGVIVDVASLAGNVFSNVSRLPHFAVSRVMSEATIGYLLCTDIGHVILGVLVPVLYHFRALHAK